jgi:TPR repeat protein
MKRVWILCLMLVLPMAHADELADANALFEKKSYAQALKLYTKLANAGNVEAQQHLGEMYWYGEAGVVDDAVAQGWFIKAAAKGNQPSATALEVMKKRVARKADIEYWTTKYDGADLTSGAFRCPAPRLPQVSKDNAEITAVSDRVDAWQNCYNAFVVNLNANTPLTKRIPADISALMKQEELDAAAKHLKDVKDTVAENAKVNSKLVLADIAAWRTATEKWVTEHNEIIKNGPTKERQNEIDSRKRNYAPPK